MPRIVGGIVSDWERGETRAVNNNQPEQESQQCGPSIQNRSFGGYRIRRPHSGVR